MGLGPTHFTLFISVKALSPNAFTFRITCGEGFNIWISEGHNSVHNTSLEAELKLEPKVSNPRTLICL